MLDDKRSEEGLPQRPATARGLIKSLAIELRAGAGEVKEPNGRTLLETSAAVIGGLIKAFDDYEKTMSLQCR